MQTIVTLAGVISRAWLPRRRICGAPGERVDPIIDGAHQGPLHSQTASRSCSHPRPTFLITKRPARPDTASAIGLSAPARTLPRLLSGTGALGRTDRLTYLRTCLLPSSAPPCAVRFENPVSCRNSSFVSGTLEPTSLLSTHSASAFALHRLPVTMEEHASRSSHSTILS